MIILFNWIIKGRTNVACVFLLVILSLYYNSIDNSFQYDDKHSILENPHIRSLSNVPLFWLNPEYFSRDAENAMYRPVVLSSLAFNYALSDYDVRSYRLLNMAIHTSCCYLIFSLLLLFGADKRVAFCCVIFLAVHPLCSQSVNYISSRSELFAALGCVGALWAYVRYHINGFRLWLIISLFLFACALSSKSIAIGFPFWIIAYDIQVGKRPSLKRYFPYLIFSFVYLLFTKSLIVNAVYNEPVRELDIQLFTQSKALVYYLYMVFFPVHQSIDHAFFESIQFDSTVFFVTVLLGSLVLFIFMKRSYLVGPVIVVSSLIPTIIVPLNVLVNENRLYLPLIGLCILVSMFCSLKRPFIPKKLLFVLAIFLFLATFQRNLIWLDEFSLWDDANTKNPFSIRSNIYLGHQLRNMKDFSGAKKLFERALVLDPTSSIARAGLALTLQKSGSHAEALSEYLRTLNENKQMRDLNYNIGLVLQLMQRNEEALRYYSRVSRESPHISLAINNSGTIYEEKGMIDSALYHYDNSYKLGSNHAKENIERLNKKIERNIENALESRQWKKAEDLSRELLEFHGVHRLARFYLVITLFEQRRFIDSLDENTKLVANFPDFIQGHLQYANVLETLHHYPEAQTIYVKLLKMPLTIEFKNMVTHRLNRINSQNN